MDIGEIATLTSTILGFLGIGFYLVRVTRTITLKVDGVVLSSKVEKIHTKIEEIKDKYVRRDDLFNHLKHLEEGLARIERTQEETNKQIMKVVEQKNRSM